MKERPALFSTPMVRRLPGIEKDPAKWKTMTRRVLKQPRRKDGAKLLPELLQRIGVGHACRYGAPGDRLWVRETFRVKQTGEARSVYYRADEEWHAGAGWRPSIFMPRWASRITLEVTDVRVERLQDISEEDAQAEGVTAAPFCKVGRPAGKEHVEAFADLWDTINEDRAPWAANPWVWVVSFKRADAAAGRAA